MQSKQAIYTANVAKAKLLFNKDKETYKIVIAFNVTERTEKGAFKFPPQAKCDFVSGEFVYESLQADKERILSVAKQQLRTDCIEFV
jgi:hypothetical protein